MVRRLSIASEGSSTCFHGRSLRNASSTPPQPSPDRRENPVYSRYSGREMAPTGLGASGDSLGELHVLDPDVEGGVGYGLLPPDGVAELLLHAPLAPLNDGQGGEGLVAALAAQAPC